MLVKAIRRFKDLKANKRRNKSEIFEVTEERFEEINSTSFGILVEELEQKNVVEDLEGIQGEAKEKEDDKEEQFEFPKHTGGGYYELSNGEKVKGKEEAIKAQQEL